MTVSGRSKTILSILAAALLHTGTAAADPLDDMGELYFSLVAGHEIADRCATLAETEAKLFRRAADQLSEDIRTAGARLRAEERAASKLHEASIAAKAQAFVAGHGCLSPKVQTAASSWQELLVMFPYRPQYSGMGRERTSSN